MNEDNNQLTLSYELLVLLQWLIEYEPEKLKELITSAFDNGLEDDLKKVKNQSSGYDSSENVQNSIVDFFGLLEILLHEIYNERATKRVMEKKLMPAIDHIDTTECDTQTVQDSIEKATSKFEQEPNKNPQELLFKELLRSWKPNKKTVSN
jgi:hypothetical protein